MCHLQAFCSLPAKAQQEAERLSRVPRRLAPSQNTSASPDGDLKKMWHCNAGGSWGFKPNKDWWNKDSNWNSHSDGGCFLLLLSSSSSFLPFFLSSSLIITLSLVFRLWFSISSLCCLWLEFPQSLLLFHSVAVGFPLLFSLSLHLSLTFSLICLLFTFLFLSVSCLFSPSWGPGPRHLLGHVIIIL